MKVFDPQKHSFEQEGGTKVPAKQLQKDREAAGKPLDDELKDTFPASDPPSITTPKKRKGT